MREEYVKSFICFSPTYAHLLSCESVIMTSYALRCQMITICAMKVPVNLYYQLPSIERQLIMYSGRCVHLSVCSQFV